MLKFRKRKVNFISSHQINKIQKSYIIGNEACFTVPCCSFVRVCSDEPCGVAVRLLDGRQIGCGTDDGRWLSLDGLRGWRGWGDALRGDRRGLHSRRAAVRWSYRTYGGFLLKFLKFSFFFGKYRLSKVAFIVSNVLPLS